MRQPTNNRLLERASGVAKATEFYVHHRVLMDEVLKGENVQDRLLYAAKECPHQAIEGPLPKLSSYSQLSFSHTNFFFIFSLILSR